MTSTSLAALTPSCGTANPISFISNPSKTAASWDIRKERDAERDMQGLSEGVEVERRLGALWHAMHDEPKPDKLHVALEREVAGAQGKVETSVVNYLRTLDAPPRILWRGLHLHVQRRPLGATKDLTPAPGHRIPRAEIPPGARVSQSGP